MQLLEPTAFKLCYLVYQQLCSLTQIANADLRNRRGIESEITGGSKCVATTRCGDSGSVLVCRSGLGGQDHTWRRGVRWRSVHR